MRRLIFPFLLLLAACGSKGSLEKPSGPVTPPLLERISTKTPEDAPAHASTLAESPVSESLK
jgi:predicted small lipoprotein YifL